MATEIVPYQGDIKETPNDFARAFPELERKIKGEVVLDHNSKSKLDDMHRQMRLNPPKAAVVINMHPFPLKVNGGHLFAGIEIPACEPGQPFNYKAIRGYKWSWREEEDGSVTPTPVFPIELAREFVREFNSKDIFGAGVIAYEGDGNPLKVGTVETYDDRGQRVEKEEVVEYETSEGVKSKERAMVPVKRPLADIMEEARKKRNAHYMKKVREADRDYNLPGGQGRKNITDHHLRFAEVLFHERELPEMPSWNLASRLEAGLEDDNCPSCLEPRRTGAVKCSCSYIFDPFKAYEFSLIEYGHLAMDRMTSDEWEAANDLKAERDAARAGKGKKDKKEKTQ